MYRTSLAFCVLFSSALGYSQTRDRQMVLDSLYESMKINPEPDKAYVHVSSQIPNLRFDSNRMIDKVNSHSSGDWDIWLPGGTHILRIFADGYQMLELPAFNFASKRSYEMRLKARAVYSIVTNPTGAVVRIDDRDTLTSPGRTDLGIGIHKIEISKPHYESIIYNINITGSGIEDEKKLSMLESPYTLLTDPPDADVVIDGHYAGKTPIQTELALGEHEVQISKTNCEGITYRFNLDQNGFADRKKLVLKVGVYTIETIPPAVLVTIDGVEKGKTPLDIELGLGKHAVDLEMENYESETYEVNLTNSGLKQSRRLMPYYSDEVGVGVSGAMVFEKNMFRDSTANNPSAKLRIPFSFSYRYNVSSHFAAGIRFCEYFVSLSNYQFIYDNLVKTDNLTFFLGNVGLEGRWTFSRKNVEPYCFVTIGAVVGNLTSSYGSSSSTNSVGGFAFGAGGGAVVGMSEHFALSFELCGSFGSGAWSTNPTPFSDGLHYNPAYLAANVSLLYRWAGPEN